jgi:hypothetical protein
MQEHNKMKSKFNQQGFHIWVIALIIVVVAALGFAGWYVWDKNKADNSANTTNPTAVPTPTADPTADWQTYTDDTYGFSFRYPSDATASVNTYADLNASDVAVVTNDQKYGITITVNESMPGDEIAQRTIKFDASVSDGGLVLTKASDSSKDLWAGQTTAGYMIYATLTYNNNEYTFDSRNNTNSEDADGALAFYEQVLGTFKFN